ncbi:MAG: MFS transporter [Polyangiaceae bacterium]
MSRILPSVSGLPRSLWLLCVGIFVNRLGGFVVPFLAIYLTRVRNLPVERAGVIVSLLGLGAFASGPIGGHLADRLGRRPALAIATALGGSAMLAMGFVRSIPQLAATAFVLGVCGDLYRPTIGAMVADLVPSVDRARAYGFMYWAVNLGFSASLMCAGFLAEKSFTLLFVGDALTTFLFGAIIFVMVPETKPEAAELRAGAQTNDKSPIKKGGLAPYQDARFMAFCFLSLCTATIFLQGQMTMPLDLRANGISNQEFGALLSLNGITIVLVQPFAAGITDRFSRGAVLAVGAILIGVGMATCGVAHGRVPIYIAAVLLFTFGEIANAPVTPSVVADMAPTAHRGAYQGAYQFSWGGGTFLAPFLGSYVMSAFGAGVLWTSCAFVGLLAAVGFVIVTPARTTIPGS